MDADPGKNGVMATDEEIRVCAKALLVAVGDVGANTANQILNATEHSGDCTKQPWTCNVCYADEHRKMATVAITALRAMDREKVADLARRQTPVEPKFYKALYENRSEMYLKSDDSPKGTQTEAD